MSNDVGMKKEEAKKEKKGMFSFIPDKLSSALFNGNKMNSNNLKKKK